MDVEVNNITIMNILPNFLDFRTLNSCLEKLNHSFNVMIKSKSS